MDSTYNRPPDHDERLRAAEQFAQWYLGDRRWAQRIIGAYMYPNATLEELRRERKE